MQRQDTHGNHVSDEVELYTLARDLILASQEMKRLQSEAPAIFNHYRLWDEPYTKLMSDMTRCDKTIRGNKRQLEKLKFNLSTDSIESLKEIERLLAVALQKQAALQAPLVQPQPAILLIEITTEEVTVTPPEYRPLTYAEALARFTNKLNEPLAANAPSVLRNLNAAGRHLLNTLANENSMDIAYRTRILNAAYELRCDGMKDENHQMLYDLVRLNTHGKCSVPSIVAGAVMIFLGVAILAASAAVWMLSIAMATPLSIAAYVAGAGMIVGGVLLCRNGRSKGVDKALRDYQYAGNKFHLYSSRSGENEQKGSVELAPGLRGVVN